MAEFVRAQIFGTTFEITSRCAFSRLARPPPRDTPREARRG